MQVKPLSRLKERTSVHKHVRNIHFQSNCPVSHTWQISIYVTKADKLPRRMKNKAYLIVIPFEFRVSYNWSFLHAANVRLWMKPFLGKKRPKAIWSQVNVVVGFDIIISLKEFKSCFEEGQPIKRWINQSESYWWNGDLRDSFIYVL